MLYLITEKLLIVLIVYCEDYYEIVDDLPKFPQSSEGELEGDSSQ